MNFSFTMCLRTLFACLLLTVTAYPIVAQQAPEVTIGFYNVENLYDTIPSPFGNDRDYTPQGRLHWDSTRYTAKLHNLARVLDALSLDVAGLAEVESEQAVRDLVITLRTDYNYIHRTTSDRRGIDMALLYKGDKFVPERIRLVSSDASREFLYVRGELLGRRIDLIVCHLPSQLNTRAYRDRTLTRLYNFADSLQNCDPAACPVIMGDFNADPTDRIMRRRMLTDMPASGRAFLFTPMLRLAREGLGSYAYDGRWRMYDNLFLSSKMLGGAQFRYVDCGVFIQPWMLDYDNPRRRGYPLRTFAEGTYRNGYSDHLPVFVRLALPTTK